MREHTAQPKPTTTPLGAVQWPSGPVIDVALSAGETCVAWNGEVLRFAGDRLRQDTELGLALTKCRSWTEAAELQRDWAAKTTQDYFEEGTRLIRMATLWSADRAGRTSEDA